MTGIASHFARAWLLALFLLAGQAFVSPLQATTADATGDLAQRVVKIQQELEQLRRIVIAGNLATDPSVRSAARTEAAASIQRLLREVREAETIYAQLARVLPNKVNPANRARVTRQIAEIRAGLGGVARDLGGVNTVVAQLR